MRILPVEDERIIARALRSQLIRLGFEVPQMAHSKAEAVNLASRFRPDLVLMDIRLGQNRDGIEAAEEIHRRFDIPVVYLTAHSDPETLAVAQNTNPHGFVLKPAQDRELEVAIKIARRQHAAANALQQANARQAALASLGARALAGEQVPALLDAACAAVRQLLGLPDCAIETTADGVLQIVTTTPKSFSQPEIEFQNAICTVLATAIARRRTEEDLQSALSSKTTLIQELHHRVKNNLALISGMISMQVDSLPGGPTRSAFEDCRRRIASMAMVHDHLHIAEQPDRVDFGQYVKEVADELYSSYGVDPEQVKLTVAAQRIDLPIHVAVPCGQILHELLSNSLKYAFPAGRQGGIRVQFGEAGRNRLALICEDSGVGIPAGVDWRNSPSLGLRIVRILARQISGELTRPPTAQGTRFRCEFANPFSNKP